MVYLPPPFHHPPESPHCPHTLELCRGVVVLVRFCVHLPYENQGSIFLDTLTSHCSEGKSISSHPLLALPALPSLVTADAMVGSPGIR